jgi:dienelactone hydrolase
MNTLRGALRTLAALVVWFGALSAQGNAAPANFGIAPDARNVPGVVIVDPGAGRTSSTSSILARRLVRAGYATLIVTHDPLGAAVTLRRQSAVRSDDISVVGYGDAASAVLAALAERYDQDVAQPPAFRSAIAFSPNCARHYGDWLGYSLATHRGSGSTGAPHGGDAATAGLYRTPTPLLIVNGRAPCSDLAHDSFTHEYFVEASNDDTFAGTLAFLADYSRYSVVSFPSTQTGTTLVGELTRPSNHASVPAIIISPGTAGIEGFSFWERPWAQRLRAMGYASLIVDSYMSRHSAWKNHWRIDARTVRARDLLDAQAYLSKQSFVRPLSIGLLGRSSGGTAILAAIVQVATAPATPPPFGIDIPPPFMLAVADYGYCQLSYGAWPGGTPPPSAAIAYRTSVPLLLQVGTDDMTVSAAACASLVQSSQAAGVPIELQVYPGEVHRFDAGVQQTPAAIIRASVERITSFIETHSTH